MIDRSEYKDYSANFLAKMDLTVYALQKVADYRVDGAGILFSCMAAKCDKVKIGSSMNQESRYFVNSGEFAPAALRLDFIKGDILRIRLQSGHAVEELTRPMLCGAAPLPRGLLVEDGGGTVTASCGNLVAKVQKAPFRLDIYTKDGKLLYSQYNDDAHSTTSDRRRGLNETADTLAAEKIRGSYPAFEVYPFGYVVDNATKSVCYTEAVKMGYDETFYGFGESFDRAAKNGQEKLIWTINPLGVSTVKSYKPVPFFMSSRGYGLYLNSPRQSVFDMGSYFFKAYTVASFDTQLDLFFINGPSYQNILKGYCALTGSCQNVPPKWSFGVWMGRNCYRSRQEIEEVCDELRRRALPCDVIHLDWDYTRLNTHGFDFLFDEQRYPDPAGMMAEMAKKGYRLSLWQLPYLTKGTPVYEECLAKGYFSAPPQGKSREGDPYGILDFSNPDAVAWYQRRLRALLQAGVAVIKTDFGENADADYLYQNMDGADIHNLYPLLYNAAAYEVCREVHGADALLWGRSTFAGGQRFPLYWGGDSDSDYLGLYHSLRGGLSLGLTGFPFWSHDVGGYFGQPEKNVYIRWMQLGMLSSHIRFHGTTAREPWHYGDTAVEVYRRYAAIRYSLVEYLYAEAHHAVENRTPLMRHLVLDFPGDPTVRFIDDEYMLGRNILVVGVFSDDPVRRLYLPPGHWLCWHTGKMLEGGRWLDYSVPIEVLPIFLRGGTATPLVEPKSHVDAEPDAYIRWRLIPQTGAMQALVKKPEGDILLRALYDGNRLDVRITGGGELEHRLEIYGIGAPQRLEGGRIQDFDSERRRLMVVARKDEGELRVSLHGGFDQ